MKVLLLLGLVLYASAFYKVQYEKAVENSVHWAPVPYHVLQAGSSMPRSVDVDVSFQQRFNMLPEIVYGAFILDWEKGQPAGFDTTIVSITQEGFKIRYSAVSSRQLYSIQLNWMAFFDPNIKTFTFTGSNATELMAGKNKQRFTDFDVKFPSAFKEIPQVAIFISGVQFLQRNNVISLTVNDVSNKGFRLRAQTWYTSVVSFFRIVGIAAPISTLYTQRVSFRVPDYNHIWAIRNPPQDRGLDLSSPISEVKFQTGERFELFGFSGFDQDDQTNQRTYIRNFVVSKREVTFTVGTWWDSALYQADVNYFIYVPDKSQKMFDPVCAEIFSDCNYEGDSVTICDRVNSFPKTGWNKPIKSYYIPDGKVLKIYNEEDQKGTLLRLEESNQCIEQIRFTFAQILGITEKE